MRLPRPLPVSPQSLSRRTRRAGARHVEALVAKGQIRSYGWSTDYPDRAAVFAEGPRCTAIQFEFNVLDDNPAVVAVCEQHNRAAINRGPLAMGVLTGK